MESKVQSTVSRADIKYIFIHVVFGFWIKWFVGIEDLILDNVYPLLGEYAMQEECKSNTVNQESYQSERKKEHLKRTSFPAFAQSTTLNGGELRVVVSINGCGGEARDDV